MRAGNGKEAGLAGLPGGGPFYDATLAGQGAATRAE